MSTAPKPPSKKLLLAAGLTVGTAVGIWGITLAGSLVFSGIPASRMPWYVGAGLIGILAGGYLGTRYAIQKHRRDAWWDGFAAGDEPLAEVIQLRDLKGYNGDVREFRTNSPS